MDISASIIRVGVQRFSRVQFTDFTDKILTHFGHIYWHAAATNWNTRVKISRILSYQETASRRDKRPIIWKGFKSVHHVGAYSIKTLKEYISLKIDVLLVEEILMSKKTPRWRILCCFLSEYLQHGRENTPEWRFQLFLADHLHHERKFWILIIWNAPEWRILHCL